MRSGSRKKPACASPSATLRRGSQNRPSCSPYSTVTAETRARSGLRLPFTQPGTSSSLAFFSAPRAAARSASVAACRIAVRAESSCRRASSSASCQMSMSAAMR
jgi:hypothetical protein